MKTPFFKIIFLVCFLALITVFITGCPSSTTTVTKADSTQGNPPRDSTQGNPPN